MGEPIEPHAREIQELKATIRALQARIAELEGKTHDPYHFVEVEGEKFWSEKLVNRLQARIDELENKDMDLST